VLALLEPGEVAAREPAQEGDAPEAAAPSVSPAPAESAAPAAVAASSPSRGEPSADNGEAPGAPREGQQQKMGPAVRKLIEEHDLDPAAVEGSGRDGRVSKTDVLDYLARQRDSGIGLDAEAPSTPATATRPAPGRGEQRVPMTRLRARIAERLVQAQQNAAMLTTFNEVDMSAVVALRKRYQEQFQKRYDIKLGFMSFFIRAAVEALREFPLINASIDGNEIVYHDYFDIGVAASTDRGLLVPVLRDVQSLTMADIEKAIADFGQRARGNEIGIEELTGGTFTITNGGIFGSLMSTPILNPPQSGILGMHAIQDRPVVVDGEIVARPSGGVVCA
jgi:2-oxoglutarate dehydrogenase E2 component (dihydrolipoamide succinyltransferase)